MDKDTEIKKGLAAAGIPKSAWSLSLPTLGQQDLREAVRGKVFLSADPRGAWVYSAPANANNARSVFYTLAKEMFLTGTTVACISLLPFSKMLAGDEEMPDLVAAADMLFLLDFYETGCRCPYDDETAARLRYWLRSRFESGKAVSFLADAGLESADWWSPSLRSFLGVRITEYRVEAQ